MRTPPRPLPLVAALVLTALVPACDGNGQTTRPSPSDGGTVPSGVGLETVATGLDFPVYATAPPGDPRLFVVEKPGRIRIVEDGRVLEEPFLDVSDRVSRGTEQGLLSLAFHPDYASNGRFFVDYTDAGGTTRVVEYRVSADPDRADPAPVRTVLSVPQPYSNHNGGLVVFGPDGMLYVGLGDGGSGGDPRGNGQDPGTLLATILRLDVDGGDPYRVPPDNPFAGREDARGEVWQYGLRNPWRFSFDRRTGGLYVADVGQNAWEEVDAVPRGDGGRNFGWNRTEGTHCYRPSQGCDRSGLTPPVLEYGHDDGCSVTGGYVYRGAAVPALAGLYLYSDYCSGFVRSFRLSAGEATERRRWPDLEPAEKGVTSFGEDAAGELYLTTANGGLYRIVAR